MIEPLRYNKEVSPPYAVLRPVYCGICLATKKRKANPGLACKQCDECPRPFLCADCDFEQHNSPLTKDHIRRLLVVGPGVKKRVLTRGDAVNFPLPLDMVSVRVSCKVFFNGSLLYQDKPMHLTFQSGQSGNCIHVQILECRGIISADLGGTSDPFIVSHFNGVKIGMTRVRPRTLNPTWDAETIVVPIDDNLPDSRRMKKSQKDMLRMELYDFDFISQNDFLGHVEIKREKLMQLAEEANEHPIRLPFTTREFHGNLFLKFGLGPPSDPKNENRADVFKIKVVKGDSLEVTDPFSASDPFCMVYLGDRLVGKTHVCKNTQDPEWTNDDMLGFITDNDRTCTVDIAVAEVEERQLMLIEKYRALGWFPNDISSELAMFRIEVFDCNRWIPSFVMGTVRVPVDAVGKYVPRLYKEIFPQVKKLKALKHRILKPVKPLEEDEEDFEQSQTGSQIGSQEGSQEDDDGEDVDENESETEDLNVDADAGIVGDAQCNDEELVNEGGSEQGGNAADQQGVFEVEGKPQHWIVRLFCGKVMGMKKEYERDLTEWSGLMSYDVEMDNSGAEDAGTGDRGELVVRLVRSIRGSVVKGLDEGVRHMTLGEKSLIKVRYDHAYSSFSMGANIPPRSDLVFKVELLQINGWGAFGMPLRQFKRFMRMSARMIVRFNLFWALVKAFERRTRFFERILVFLRIKSKLSEQHDEDLDQQYDDGDIDYANSDEEVSDSDLEVDSNGELDDTISNDDEGDVVEEDEHGESLAGDSLLDPLVSIGDSIQDNLARKLRPQRIIKIDKAVVAGANIMWTHRPRIVLSKRRKPKLTAAQKQAQREERRRLREERREARRRRKEGRQEDDDNDGADGDSIGGHDDDGEGADGNADDASNREEVASVSGSVASGNVAGAEK